MKTLTYTVAKNALANAMRGGAGAVVAFTLPPILSRVLTADRFAAWALLLQIAAYANFLDFGVQTAVARFVAQAIEKGETEERNRYVSSAVMLLCCAAVLGFLGVVTAAALLPEMFNQLNPSLLAELRQSLILLAALSALAFPSSAFTGIFVGLHRNEYPAIITGTGRLLSAGLIILIVHRTQSLLVMASLIGLTNVVAGLLQYVLATRMIPDVQVSLRLVSPHHVRALVRFCAGLGVWSFAMFLVGGLDLTIVGHFRFGDVASYSIASNLVLIVAGVANAATSAMIAPAAVLHARREYRRLGNVVLRATRYLTYILIALSLPFFLFGLKFLTFWVGGTYAPPSFRILEILLLANVIRMLGGPYAAVIIGVGRQGEVIGSPLFEGFVNLALSLLAGAHIGGLGVALGTLVGGIAGFLWHLVRNVPRIGEVDVSASRLFREGVIIPIFDLAFAASGISFAALAVERSTTLRIAAALLGCGMTLLIQLQRSHRARKHRVA